MKALDTPDEDRTRGTRPHDFSKYDRTGPVEPHGATLAEILAHSVLYRYDLGNLIGRQFDEYLDALAGKGKGPYDLPGGAPVDDPQPPSSWWRTASK